MNDYKFKTTLPDGAVIYFNDLDQATHCIGLQEKVFRKKLLIQEV